MQPEEIEAKLLLSKINGKIALEQEFEKLAPNTMRDVYRSLGAVGLIGLISWFFPELLDSPGFYF